jgi:hypothetical protein
MSATTRRMLEIVDDAGLVPHRTVAPSEHLVAAARRLAALLSNWTDEVARELFADNVNLDEPLPRRGSRAVSAAAAHGALTVLRLELATPTRGIAVMQHADGTLVNVEVELSPTVPPRIQFYEVSAA